MITAQEVKDYSVFQKVKDREDPHLQNDIIEALADIEMIVGHSFTDYETTPERAKLAALKLSQFYALVNSDESMIKGIKAESLGDYSYTLSDGTTIQKPEVAHLLVDYVVKRKGRTSFRMRGI
jgi:hypothetical protein